MVTIAEAKQSIAKYKEQIATAAKSIAGMRIKIPKVELYRRRPKAIEAEKRELAAFKAEQQTKVATVKEQVSKYETKVKEVEAKAAAVDGAVTMKQHEEALKLAKKFQAKWIPPSYVADPLVRKYMLDIGAAEEQDVLIAAREKELEKIGVGFYDSLTKTYTAPEGYKQSMLPENVPEGTIIIPKPRFYTPAEREKLIEEGRGIELFGIPIGKMPTIEEIREMYPLEVRETPPAIERFEKFVEPTWKRPIKTVEKTIAYGVEKGIQKIERITDSSLAPQEKRLIRGVAEVAEIGKYAIPYVGAALLLGGAAERVITPSGREELGEISEHLQEKGVPKTASDTLVYGAEVGLAGLGAYSLFRQVKRLVKVKPKVDDITIKPSTTKIIGSTKNKISGETIQHFEPNIKIEQLKQRVTASRVYHTSYPRPKGQPKIDVFFVEFGKAEPILKKTSRKIYGYTLRDGKLQNWFAGQSAGEKNIYSRIIKIPIGAKKANIYTYLEKAKDLGSRTIKGKKLFFSGTETKLVRVGKIDVKKITPDTLFTESQLRSRLTEAFTDKEWKAAKKVAESMFGMERKLKEIKFTSLWNAPPRTYKKLIGEIKIREKGVAFVEPVVEPPIIKVKKIVKPPKYPLAWLKPVVKEPKPFFKKLPKKVISKELAKKLAEMEAPRRVFPLITPAAMPPYVAPPEPFLAPPKDIIGVAVGKEVFFGKVKEFPIIKPVVVPVEEVRVEPFVAVKPVVAVKPRVDLLLKIKPRVVPVVRPRIAPIQVISPKAIQVAATALKIKPRLKPRLKLKKELALVRPRPTIRRVARPITKVKPLIVPVIPPPVPKKAIAEPLKLKKHKPLPGEPGYVAFVKRRGLWKLISPVVRRKEAIWFGAKRARKTLAAAFKIKKVAAPISVKRYPVLAKPALKVFRPYKIVKGKRVPLKDYFIQRREFRLAAPTEVKEIQAARRAMSLKVPKSKSKTKWI